MGCMHQAQRLVTRQHLGRDGQLPGSKVAWDDPSSHGGALPVLVSPQPGTRVLGLCSENCSINARLAASMFLDTMILSTTNRSPPGLPAVAGIPWPFKRSLRPLELPAGIVSDFMPSRAGTSIFGSENRLRDTERNLDLEVWPSRLK